MGLIIDLINVAFQVYGWIILARIILSWVPHNPYHPVIRFLYDLTEPYLSIFRRFIPPLGMIDLSPLVALITLYILRAVLVSVLIQVF